MYYIPNTYTIHVILLFMWSFGPLCTAYKPCRCRNLLLRSFPQPVRRPDFRSAEDLNFKHHHSYFDVENLLQSGSQCIYLYMSVKEAVCAAVRTDPKLQKLCQRSVDIHGAPHCICLPLPRGLASSGQRCSSRRRQRNGPSLLPFGNFDCDSL